MRGRRSQSSPPAPSPSAKHSPPPHSGVRRHRHGERVPTASERRAEEQIGLGLVEADASDAGGTAELQGRILLGPHAVAEALRSGRRVVRVAYLSVGDRGERFRIVAALARSRGVPVRQADRDLIETLAAGRAHQGIVALAGDYPYLDLAGLEQVVVERGGEALVVALDRIQDPQNLGAIVRSCVAFGVDVIVTTERHSAGVTDAAVRAAAGATELARIARVANLAEALRRLAAVGLDIVGVDPEGEHTLDSAGLRRPIAVVFGSEGPGLRRLTKDLCTRKVRIRIAAGGVASLNVSVAAGIVLHSIVGAGSAA